jgi:toxin ParE1/3/4
VTAFAVRLTSGARKDLQSIHGYIAASDSRDKADYVAYNILHVIESLAELPLRGVIPKELAALGNRNYRELFFKPYRILYTVRENTVFIALIADGRRDMQSLLSNRLLRS